MEYSVVATRGPLTPKLLVQFQLLLYQGSTSVDPFFKNNAQFGRMHPLGPIWQLHALVMAQFGQMHPLFVALFGRMHPLFMAIFGNCTRYL